MSESDPIVVCIAFPGIHDERHLEALRAIDRRIEPVVLPVDAGASFAGQTASQPHAEPPPWAIGRAKERAAMLARTHVLVALHTPADLPALAPNLRWIQGIGAGVEQFAKAGVPAEGVVVTNASGVGARSMSEWVLARLLQVWKRFPESDALQREGRWKQTYGRTFAGSTIGVVGLGHIGCEVATRVRALGARVLGTRRSARPGDSSDVADALFPLDRLHEMLAQCDAVVVTAPETPETHHMIGADAFAAMRDATMLVNVARGSLVDEAALLAALESGRISWAALDVFETEPLPEDSPFWTHPRVLVTGHSSPSIDRYMDDVFELLLENMQRWVKNEPLRNQIDPVLLGFGEH